MVMGIGVVVAVVGILAVAPRSENEPGMRAINRGFFLSAVLAAAGVLVLSLAYMKSFRPFLAIVIGLALAAVIQLLTEHYTSTRRRPVKDIVEASLTGPATNVLAGFSEGLESSVWSILAIGGAIIGCFYLGHDLIEQLFFVSLAGIGMLSVVGVIVSMDTFGPVSDNAQGIAEMSGDVDGRGAEILTSLDADRELDQGHHQGHRHRDRGAGGDVAVRGLPGGRPPERHPGQPPAGARRAAGRRVDRVPVLLVRHPGRRADRVAGRHGGAKAVPRAPGDHGLHREARLQRRRGHRHEVLAARAGDAGHAGGPGADHRRLPAEPRGARRLPGRRDRHRAAHGRHAVERRRRLGQREEARGGRGVRRQGVRGRTRRRSSATRWATRSRTPPGPR